MSDNQNSGRAIPPTRTQLRQMAAQAMIKRRQGAVSSASENEGTYQSQ